LKVCLGKTLMHREQHIARDLGVGWTYFRDKHKVILVAEHHFIKTYIRFGDKVPGILDNRL
jgi:hypothetical protein